MNLNDEKRNLKEFAFAFKNQKVVLNTEHDVFALLGKDLTEINKTVDGLNTDEQILSKYRLLHHALDQAKTTNSHTAIKSTLQEVVRVLNEQKVAPLKHEIDTLLQDPVGKHIGIVESLNTEDNRDLGKKTEQKLQVIGVRSQKQWDAIVSDETRSALLVKIFQNAGFGNSACTQLQKAIDWRKNKLGGISHGIDIATISDENKDKIHEAMMIDSNFKDALKNGLSSEVEKHINPFLKGNKEKHFFKDTLWEAYQDFLEALQIINKNKLDDISYKKHGSDFLQSSEFAVWRNKMQINIRRGARYTNPDKITNPGGIVQNGGTIDLKYDGLKNEIIVITPNPKTLLVDEIRTHYDDDAIKETTVEAKASYVVVEKGGEQKSYPLSSPIQRSKIEGAERISVNYSVEGTLGYKDENLKEMISYEIPKETIVLEEKNIALNELLASVLPEGPNNGDFNDEKNIEGGKPINSEPLKITGLTQDVVIDRLNNAEISFNGKDFYPRGSAQLKDRLIKDGESIYLQVVSGPNPKDIRTGSVTINGKELSFSVETKEVTVTPVIFSEPHASRLDGNTETKYDFAGTGPINKTGGTITITDGGGGTVRTETNLQTNGTGEWKRNIDLDGLPTGSYTVTVTIDGQTQPRTIQYVEKAADLPDFPSFDKPGPNVFGKSPVLLEGKLMKGQSLQIQRWDTTLIPNDWVDEGGRIHPDVVSKVWSRTVRPPGVGSQRYRAVPCLDDGTLHPLRATEHTFEVGYLRMENFANPDRDTINLRVHGEFHKNVTYTLSKKDGKNRPIHREIPLILNSAREDVTLNNLGLTHGDWKIQIKQDDARGTPQTLDHTFTVDPAPTIVNPLALNQRRQILTGTGEPGEKVDMKIKIGGNPEITKDTTVDALGNRSFQLDDLVTGPCAIEVTCAGNTVRQNINLNIPSRKPQLNHGDIVVNEGQKTFDVSGYLPRECLDCNRVEIRDKDGKTLKTLELGNRTRGGAIRDAGRNIADRGRNRRRDNSFETDMNISDLGLDINQSMPLTIVPVGIDKKKHDDEAVTFNVKYQEDIKQRRATAKSPAGIIKTSAVEFKGVAPKAKRVRLWKEGIGLGHGFLRGKSEVEEIDVVDGKWETTQTILKDGNQSWRVAALDDNGNLGPSSPINFRMQLPENEGKLPWWKKLWPGNWFGKGKKGAGKEGEEKEGGKGGKESGGEGGEGGSGSKKSGWFGGLFGGERNKESLWSWVKRGLNGETRIHKHLNDNYDPFSSGKK